MDLTGVMLNLTRHKTDFFSISASAFDASVELN